MDIKKGDNVIMLSGKDRGKTGKVLFVFPKESKVVVEKLNTVAKHLRARKQGQKGQIIHKERAIDSSRVMLVCKSCGKPSRIGKKLVGDVKVRVCKKCGAEQ
ncbi:MAG: 50S ribosomal protein L24 [Candidatus Yanofskybacteria bacterium]|nr:50S ribosomal protein L24 [Candidatus Yanofskybacteria bacterium]